MTFVVYMFMSVYCSKFGQSLNKMTRHDTFLPPPGCCFFVVVQNSFHLRSKLVLSAVWRPLKAFPYFIIAQMIYFLVTWKQSEARALLQLYILKG